MRQCQVLALGASDSGPQLETALGAAATMIRNIPGTVSTSQRSTGKLPQLIGHH